jgi:hypothetical protein
VYGTGRGALVCLELRTGKVKWRNRSLVQGSLLAAEGLLYLRGTDGQMALVEASPKGYREKGRFRQPKRSGFPTFAHPVVAGRRLYLRDDDLLFCYDLAAR